MKTVDQLRPADFATHRVWEYATKMEAQLGGETFVRPVKNLPVRSLANRVAASRMTLADGESLDALLGNIDLNDPKCTEHFLTVTVYLPSGEDFYLARYHDADYAARNSAALAAALGLPLAAVFPMHYDISDIAVGHRACVRREIPAVPASRLSQLELIALAIK